MVQLLNNASGGSNTTAVTAGNSGGLSGNAFTQVTGTAPTFDSTLQIDSPLCYNIATTTSAASYLRWDNTVLTSNPTTFWGRAYIYLSAYPAAALSFFQASTSAGAAVIGKVGVDTTGHLLTRNAANTLVTTASTPLPLTRWIRIEWKYVISATVGGISAQAAVTHPDQNGFDSSYAAIDALTQNLGSTAMADARHGITTAAATTSIRMACIGFSDVALLGPARSLVGNAAMAV